MEIIASECQRQYGTCKSHENTAGTGEKKRGEKTRTSYIATERKIHQWFRVISKKTYCKKSGLFLYDASFTQIRQKLCVFPLSTRICAGGGTRGARS